MVKGLDIFKTYFKDYPQDYVLIGGTACDISFNSNGGDFRATKDLDIVLVVEALTEDFGKRFWTFIRSGGYRCRSRSDGKAQFYRFEKPENANFPKMLELFARTPNILSPIAAIVPLHLGDAVSSLSAILLDEDYYHLLLSGRTLIDGLSILGPGYLIPFKVKAYLDLKEKKKSGLSVDKKDISKHKNDVLRIAAQLPLEEGILLPESIKNEMRSFTSSLKRERPDFSALGLPNVRLEEIIARLQDTYRL